MGNRGIIAVKNGDYAVYLHWNGGRDSVEAFIKYAELAKLYTPMGGTIYELEQWSKFVTILDNWGASVYLQNISPNRKTNGTINKDYWGTDNGIYYINNWQIVGRAFNKRPEQNVYSLPDFLRDIDEKQPKHKQLGKVLDTVLQ